LLLEIHPQLKGRGVWAGLLDHDAEQQLQAVHKFDVMESSHIQSPVPGLGEPTVGLDLNLLHALLIIMVVRNKVRLLWDRTDNI